MARKNSNQPQNLNLPPAKLKIFRSENDTTLMVYDSLRNKNIILTPEEYVRQRFVYWLINHLGFPASHVANEVTLNLNSTKKRCDTLVYDSQGRPLVVIEYKAPYIKITKETFNQICRYNMVVQAPYIIASNGMAHYCCHINYENKSYSFLPQIPNYSDIDNSANPR